MKFHDGTDFNADAVIWNLERYLQQGQPPVRGQRRRHHARAHAAARQLQEDRRLDGRDHHDHGGVVLPVDDALHALHLARVVREGRQGLGQGRDLGPAGTGPFKITKVVQRQSVTSRARTATGIPSAWRRSTRYPAADPRGQHALAALRSGQVDWIEVPPPDGIPSLKQAGFVISTGSYPHVWPWIFNMARQGQPVKDVRVRQALNYCIDREAFVAAERHRRAVGRLAEAQRPDFGIPRTSTRSIPPRVRSCWPRRATGREAAGLQGDGLDLGLGPDAAAADERGPAGEPEGGVRRQGRVQRRRVAGAAERGARRRRQPELARRDGAQRSSPSSDVGVMARYFSAANFSPNGFNFEQWKDDEFEAALKRLSESTDPRRSRRAYAAAHERLVDNPPWLYIVHDLNPRAMSPKVKGFVSPQSWFVDLTLVSLQ